MKRLYPILAVIIALVSMFASCKPAAEDEKLSIVATYAIMGSLVQEMVGDAASVTISIPNGLDPHEWDPSAKDIEAINNADLVVQNGLGLEHGLEKTLSAAEARGVRFFTASDYVEVRYVGAGEGIPSDDPDQQIGAADPHIWTDPSAMKSVIAALADELKNSFDLDVSERAADLMTRLDELDTQIADLVSTLPQDSRKLVTGHESMGYFARRYGFKLVGAVIPSLTSQAEVSAADLAELKQLIIDNNVKVVFTEMGTPAAVASAVSRETGAELVELNTHTLPDDNSYFSLMTGLAQTVVEALNNSMCYSLWVICTKNRLLMTRN
jgi:zinc/manganese transport system substrate-binding protein